MSSFITGGELARRANTSRSLVLKYYRLGLLQSAGNGIGNSRLYAIESVALLKKMLRKKVKKSRFEVLKYLLENNKL